MKELKQVPAKKLGFMGQLLRIVTPIVAVSVLGGVAAPAGAATVNASEAAPKAAVLATARISNHPVQAGLGRGRVKSFANPMDCYSLAKNIVAQLGENFYAGFQAAMNIGGCSAFLSWGICWSTHQWWGGWARWLVGWITNGRWHTC